MSSSWPMPDLVLRKSYIGFVQGRGKKGMSDDNLAQFEEAVAILTKSGGVRVSARQHPCMHSCTWHIFPAAFSSRPCCALTHQPLP